MIHTRLQIKRSLRALVRNIAVALISASAIASVSSCADDNDDAPHIATLYDVVEFTAQDGAGSVFTLWRPDATKAVILKSATPVVNTSVVSPGESLFLAYTPLNGKAYTSGPVEVHTYGTVNNAPLLKSDTEKLDGWDSEPVYLMSLWRAGNKVCMRLRMTYDTAPRLCALIVDEATAGDEYPTAYLYHKRPTDAPNFARQYYASFNAEALWKTPGCKGLRIRVNNSNNPALNTFVVENPALAPEE